MAMYNMIGGDGREYGPVSAEQLRQWFTEGRVDRNTRVMADDGQTEWLALSEVAEFANLFVIPQAVVPPPVMPPSGTVQSAPAVAANGIRPPLSGTSNLAVASLILGILTLTVCGPFAAVPAVICGHLARRNIAASKGTLTGDGLALTGLIIGYAVIFLVLVAVGVVLSMFSKVGH